MLFLKNETIFVVACTCHSKRDQCFFRNKIFVGDLSRGYVTYFKLKMIELFTILNYTGY